MPPRRSRPPARTLTHDELAEVAVSLSSPPPSALRASTVSPVLGEEQVAGLPVWLAARIRAVSDAAGARLLVEDLVEAGAAGRLGASEAALADLLAAQPEDQLFAQVRALAAALKRAGRR